MSEKLIKESRKVFLHLAELFYEMRINTLKEHGLMKQRC
jgi:hypothetical protein